jgi:translation initiation factor 2B subunit (eIF-2B alpha/beta/delta family)
MGWDTLIEPIRSNKTAGAAELAQQAAAAVLQWMDSAEHRSLVAWKADLLAFGCALWQAQPSMAPLLNLVNHILLAIESAPTLAQARSQVRQVVQTFRRHLQRSQAELIATALPLLSPEARILTFSYSSTVLAALLAAQSRQRLRAVFCTEGRPRCEGQHLAQQLARVGVSVEFGVDAAVWRFASEASLALIGADSVTRHGVVNKLGTTGVALAARAARVPCYVICGRQKWLPAAIAAPALDQLQPAEEVWAVPPQGVRVWNGYFEYTSLDLFHGIIAEEGVLAPGEVVQRLTAMPVAAALVSPCAS